MNSNLIAVVSNEPERRVFLSRALSLAGYPVVAFARDEQLFMYLPVYRPALVLVDVGQADGIDTGDHSITTLCWRLRKEPATASIPVLLVGVIPEVRHVLLPVDGVLEAPFELADLYARVRQAVAKQPEEE